MFNLIDSHVHLDDDAFASDREAVILRAAHSGVNSMIIPSVDVSSWARIQSICSTHPTLHPAYGLHPLFLSQHAPEHLEMLTSWLAQHVTVAVGEIGLDFHDDRLDRDLQQRYFERQLHIAGERQLPVIVHARGAFEQVILTMRRIGSLRGVIHSFSGSEQQAEQLWRMGFHIGMGGPLTYDRANRLRRIVATMPIEFLLLESDAPDQPDSSHRGQRNEPAYVTNVLQTVAELRGETESAIAAATTANAKRLFGIDG